jgi:zinc protease
VTMHFRHIVAGAAFLLAATLPPAPAQATKIEVVKSPGGIEAWLVRDSTIPLVSMDFAFTGGANQDPEVKPGVSYLTAALLDDGAGELDAKAFQQRIEENAVQLRFSSGRDHFQGSIRVLRDRMDQGFDLLRLSLNRPRFDEDALERVRAQAVSSLRRETTNPNSISNRVWWKTAFPHHPYGRPTNGTLESVPTITRDDLRDYHSRVLNRGTLKVAVVGDIDAKTLGPALDRVFGALPARGQLQALPAARIQDVGRRIVIDLDVPQAVLSFGGVGLARKDPDFMPAFVVNHILGGGSFSSRLYTEVREKRGLAYGVSSHLLPLDRAALFTGGTQTSNDSAAEALKIIESEIRRMATEGPTDKELAEAKDYLKGSFPLRFDTSSKIASFVLQVQLEELGLDYIEKRNSLIDAVTIEDARRVAKRLADGGMLVTVVGRPKDLTSNEPGK